MAFLGSGFIVSFRQGNRLLFNVLDCDSFGGCVTCIHDCVDTGRLSRFVTSIALGSWSLGRV